MKPNILFFAIAAFFTAGMSAQGSSRIAVNMGIAELVSETVPEDGEVIVGYKVEERINLRFGGRITTYKVSSLNMVSKVDLGPDNRRIITPIYGKAKVKPAIVETQMSSLGTIAAQTAVPVAAPLKIGSGKIAVVNRKVLVEPDAVVAAAKPESNLEVVESNADGSIKTAKINVLHTYERTLERGYQSVDMLKRVANLRFFDGDLIKAGKWYGELYKLTQDWEPIMYFRYAQCLKAMNQGAKADEMMKIFTAKDK